MADVRAFERHIDEYPSSLPIFNRSLGEVLWHLLLAHEHVLYNRQYTNSGTASLYDAEDLKKSLKHALIWTHKYCEVSNDANHTIFSRETYSEAIDLLMLGSVYQLIFCMFSMMNNKRQLVSGFVDKQNTLHLEYDPNQLRYEALHFLTAEQRSKIQESTTVGDKSRAGEIRSSLQSVVGSCELTSDSRLKYEIGRSEYESVKAVVAYSTPGSFRLPNDWEFRGIATSEFRTLFGAMRTLSFIDTAVHRVFQSEFKAESRGYMTLDSALWCGTRHEFTERICEYERDLDRTMVDDVLKLLTYSPEVTKPDPALQPIVPWREKFLIAPQLLLSSSFERNVIAFLAREYKEEYDRTTEVFEPTILNELETAFRDRGFLVRSKVHIPGNPKLADIDILAYEADLSRMIIAEVKWVIAPGEPYEQLSRADAEEKAITRQLAPLVEFAIDNQSMVLNLIDPQVQETVEISIIGTLVMRGFCGVSHALSAVYPTVDADLLLREMRSSGTNASLLDWIEKREFLPKPGVDYEVRDFPMKFGPYSVSISGARLKAAESQDHDR